MDEYELDETVIFKKEADQLTSVADLAEALSRFGYAPDDRISHRDLVQIYRKIEKAMESQIFFLANNGRYEEAKEMRSRLTSLRQEFDDRQISSVSHIRQDQKQFFEKGAKELLNNLEKQQTIRNNELLETIDYETQNHELSVEIRRENLEKTISKLEKPSIKYSKRAIELFKAEYGLNKLKQYEDAVKVRKMLNKILPREEEQFNRSYELSLDKRRQSLEKAIANDQIRIEEKLKALHWRNVRQNDRESNITDQRIKNNKHDMYHAHNLEEKLKPEMSVKPSALWQRRQGFKDTAATLRGAQLLDKARGKKEGQHVYADTLVDKHNFIEAPMNTQTIYQSRN